MKKVFKVIVAVIMFLLVCAFVVLANCFAGSMSAKADTPTTIDTANYNYYLTNYVDINKTTCINRYNITTGTYTNVHILNDAYNLLTFYDRTGKSYFIGLRFYYQEYSSTSFSLSCILFIWDNYTDANQFSTTNYFAQMYYGYSTSINMFSGSSMTFKTANSTSRTFLNNIQIYGLYCDSYTMTINGTNYLKWVNTWIKLNYKNEIGAQTAYYNEGYTTGFSNGQKEIIENPNDFSLYTYSQYDDYGQSEYNRGFSNGSDGTNNFTTSWFLGIFKGLAQFFAIPIFGQITFGTIVLIPFSISLAWFIIRTFRGGGS